MSRVVVGALVGLLALVGALVVNVSTLYRRVEQLEVVASRTPQRTGAARQVMVPCDAGGYQHALATTCVSMIEVYR